ncbi:MAG: hypothetical protein ACOX9C_12600 [Kiritimatiellia bacterium]|jgi:sialate O-acetylesterase
MKLNPLFSDHAVLQHGISIPVWGATAPGAKVTGRIAGVKTWTLASATGSFMLRFPPLPSAPMHGEYCHEQRPH